MYDVRPFAPLYGPNTGASPGGLTASVTITGATTAASAALPGPAYNDFCQIQIANTTTAWAYVNFGIATTGSLALAAATTAASYPVAPGSVVVVTVSSEVAAASVILGAAPGTLTAVIFTRGAGT